MKLDNFNLEEYDNNNLEHRTVITELCNDNESRLYLGDLFYTISAINRRKEDSFINYSFIAYKNENAVGYISITTKEEMFEVSYGITPKYRGEHLGALLLQEFSEKVFEDFKNIDELTLMINNLNTGSKKTALLAGYDKVTSTKYTQKRW